MTPAPLEKGPFASAVRAVADSPVGGGCSCPETVASLGSRLFCLHQLLLTNDVGIFAIPQLWCALVVVGKHTGTCKLNYRQTGFDLSGLHQCLWGGGVLQGETNMSGTNLCLHGPLVYCYDVVGQQYLHGNIMFLCFQVLTSSSYTKVYISMSFHHLLLAFTPPPPSKKNFFGCNSKWCIGILGDGLCTKYCVASSILINAPQDSSGRPSL